MNRTKLSVAAAFLFTCVAHVAAQPPPETKVSNPQQFEQTQFLGIAIGTDGTSLLAGSAGVSSFLEGKTPGRVRSYRNDGFGNWIFESEFSSPQSGDDWFGRSIAVSGDTAIVGASRDDTLASDAGRAYIYTWSDGIWSLQATLSADVPTVSDTFGTSVSIDGDTVVVGVPYDDDSASASGSAYVFVRSGADWPLQAKLTASDPSSSDFFGTAVAISGDTIVAGAPNDDDGASSGGALYIFTRSGTAWNQQTKLVAPDAGTADHFGFSVALSGGTLVAGAPDDNDGGSDSGSAYAYRWDGVTWGAPEKLNSPSPASNSRFGTTVAADSDLILVGTPYLNPAIAGAFVFRHSGSSWIQEATITPPAAAMAEDFGAGLAISGNWAFISDLTDSEAGDSTGAVYAFEESGGTWTQNDKLIALDTAGYDAFGGCVAVSGDTLALGTEHDGDLGPYSGSAYIYTHVGSAWEMEAKLLPSDGAADGYFGNSIAVDGDTCIVGANLNSPGGLLFAGAAYVFTRTGGVWSEQAKLLPSDPVLRDQFGSSVAIHGDTAIIGARLANGSQPDVGAAYVFVRSAGVWTEQAKLVPPVQAAFANFGVSVSIFGDTALIGADKDNFEGRAIGSAYVFVREGTEWTFQARLQAIPDGSNDAFGKSVSLYEETAVIGSEGDDDTAANSGAAYVFERTGEIWAQQAKVQALDAGSNDRFGNTVSLLGDIMCIGAWFDGDAGSEAGSAYIFSREGTEWTQRFKLNATDAGALDHFGQTLSVGESFAAIGAPGDNDPEIDSGSVYLYEFLHTLTFQSDGTPGILLLGNPNQVLFHGDIATPVTAVWPSNAHFLGWKQDGVLITSDSTLDVGPVLEGANYTASFQLASGASGWEFYE